MLVYNDVDECMVDLVDVYIRADRDRAGGRVYYYVIGVYRQVYHGMTKSCLKAFPDFELEEAFAMQDEIRAGIRAEEQEAAL